MPLQLNDRAKLNQIIQRIEVGRFDENDVDILLMRLREHAPREGVFREVANFVAHSDARDRGLAHQSITGFVDSIQYFQEYVSESRSLVLDVPFPAYIHRLFVSQARLSDESKLKSEFKMGRSTLIKKIKENFAVNQKTGTCVLKNKKCGVEFFAALQFITGIIHSREAFHVRDFHYAMKDVMRAQKITFNVEIWNARADRISLAILCLVSNTTFKLQNETVANCRLGTENHSRLVYGETLLPPGTVAPNLTTFGSLVIFGEATVRSEIKGPLQVMFPLIATDLDPLQHCAPDLFVRDYAAGASGGMMFEKIDLGPDMSLTADFKLVRTDSRIELS